MLWTTSLLLLASCLAPANALTEAEAGVVDWQTTLIGAPLLDSLATGPSFHRTKEESVIVTATASNVLAAVFAGNGTVAWRHHWNRQDQISSYSKHDDVVVSLSGAGGATLRLFDSLRGTLLLEKRLHDPLLGRLAEPGMGTASTLLPSGDILVLTNSHQVHLVSRTTGDVAWTWTSEDAGSLVVYNKIVTTPEVVYVVGLASGVAGQQLQVTALNPSTGAVLESKLIDSNVLGPDVLTLSRAGADPVVAWLDKSVPTSFALTPALDRKPQKARGEYAKLFDVGLGEHGWLVAVTDQDQSRILGQGDDGVLKGVWEFDFPGPRSTRSDLHFAGGVTSNGSPYLARVHFSKSMGNLAHVALYAPTVSTTPGSPEKGAAAGFAFPFQPLSYGQLAHVAIQPIDGQAIRAKVLVTTSAGSVQLWDHEGMNWTRDEALAYVTTAEVVELPERAAAAAAAEGGVHEESFVARLQRHLSDTQNLPAYIRAFTTRFITGSYETASTHLSTPSDGAQLVRDQFGFRKVLVAATPFGTVVGLDGASGKPLWRRVLGDLNGGEGARMSPVKMFVHKTAAEGGPEVMLVAQRRDDSGAQDTVVFHINALTGADARPDFVAAPLLMGVRALPTGIVEVFQHTLPSGDRTLLLVTSETQVVAYPALESTSAALKDTATDLYFALRIGRAKQRKLLGHRISSSADSEGRYSALPAWSLSLALNEDINDVLSVPAGASVASLGKVTGNRTTLYKYLNPRLTAVVTANTEGGCGIKALDGATGAVVYAAEIPGVKEEGQSCTIKAAIAENWLVWHYWDAKEKAWRLVSVELYEGQGVDQKRKSSEVSAQSPAARDVQSFSQTFVFPHAVSALAFTTTQYGITARDLVVATPSGHILTYPRRLLDPRRPRSQPSAFEAEEGLIPYDALLPDDPRRTISHRYPVLEVRRLITSPTALESTSIVCALGLDLFCSRVAPSRTFDVLSESFNKPQLVLTCAALMLAIFVTKPMVARKRLRERWFR